MSGGGGGAIGGGGGGGAVCSYCGDTCRRDTGRGLATVVGSQCLNIARTLALAIVASAWIHTPSAWLWSNLCIHPP